MRRTDASVEGFLACVPDERRGEDAGRLCAMTQEITSEPPVPSSVLRRRQPSEPARQVHAILAAGRGRAGRARPCGFGAHRTAGRSLRHLLYESGLNLSQLKPSDR